MRTNEELKNEIDYLRNVISYFQDEANLDSRRYESLLNYSFLMSERIKSLEIYVLKRREIVVNP